MATLSRFFSALAILILFTSVAAHADTFNISNGTFDNGGTFSGSFTYDPTTTWITAASITVVSGGATYDPSFFPFLADGPDLIVLGGYAGVPYLALSITGTDPTFAINDLGTYFFLNPPFTFTHATSATISATPEPSSLALLGTGVVGLAGMVRRRYMTVQPASAA